MHQPDYTALAWIAAGLVLLWLFTTWQRIHRPDRRQLLERYDALKERAETERRIARDERNDQRTRTLAANAAETAADQLAYMRRTGRLPD